MSTRFKVWLTATYVIGLLLFTGWALGGCAVQVKGIPEQITVTHRVTVDDNALNSLLWTYCFSARPDDVPGCVKETHDSIVQDVEGT